MFNNFLKIGNFSSNKSTFITFLNNSFFKSSCDSALPLRLFSAVTHNGSISNDEQPVRVLGQQYHILDFSPWPFLLSLSLLGNLVWMVVWMFYLAPFVVVVFSFLITGFNMMCWWWDVHYEGIQEGQHTAAVTRGMRIGMILFIVSEVFFFIAFFWAYFHNALNPSIYIGGVWPPYGLIPYTFNPEQVFHYSAVNFALSLIDIPGCLPAGKIVYVTDQATVFSIASSSENLVQLSYENSRMHTLIGTSTWNPYNMPLAMTFILVTSGFTLTASHVALCIEFGSLTAALRPLFVTLILAVAFLLLQAFEYVNLPISINDGIFGSTFFMATGFHGFHVLIGSIFLLVCFIRMYKRFFACDDHVSLEAAAWYWHFVDVVWIFLFVAMYWWARPDDYVLFYFDPPELVI